MKVLPWLLRQSIRIGELTLIAPDGPAEVFGNPDIGPHAALRIIDPTIDRDFLINPELGFAEGYMDGRIDVAEGSLRDVLEIINLNYPAMGRIAPFAFNNALMRMVRRFHQNNSLMNARRNAAAHYDIGNDLYRLFLDADLQYSCAYFATGHETLAEAQLAKKRHIAAKLMLKPGQRVLDIGCGWGGLALYLAQVADVQVTGVTLAREQLSVAQARARDAGLADRVRFELRDYRHVEGQFDRIVSVGMLEHVGAYHLNEYFRHVAARLNGNGIAMIHSIFTNAPPKHTGAFVRKYIFPGGYMPSLSETFAAIEKSGLWPLDSELLRLHYAYTLAEWGRNFAVNRERAKALYDDRFCRMWELYLAGAEASFRSGALAVLQVQLGHDRQAVPITRDYLVREETRLAEREQALHIGGDT